MPVDPQSWSSWKERIHKLHHPPKFSFSLASWFYAVVSGISYRLDEEATASLGASRSLLMTDRAPWHTFRLMLGADRMLSSLFTTFWTWEEFMLEVSTVWFRSWFITDWGLAVVVVSATWGKTLLFTFLTWHSGVVYCQASMEKLFVFGFEESELFMYLGVQHDVSIQLSLVWIHWLTVL